MFLKYIILLVKCLDQIHVGTLELKIKASVQLGFLISPLIFGVHVLLDKLLKWGLDNQDYIFVVLIAVVLDHILGTIKHLFFDRDFTWKKNIVGLFSKLGLVVACGFLFEGLNVIIKQDTILKAYLITVTRLIVFLYPAGSAFGNSSVLSGGKFPPKAWLDRLNNFQLNLKPKDLMSKNEQNGK